MFRPRLVLSRAMSRQPPGCSNRRRQQPHHLAIKDVTVTQVNLNFKPEVRVIEDTQSATDVIERVRNDGVVGLGVQGQGPGLVQLREVSGDIHIFRTGRNLSLLQRGSGLKDMLEDPSTLKVVHSCGCANEAFWSHGIRIWGVFDIAMADKVISYQTAGSPLTSQRSAASLDHLCRKQGLRINPLRQALRTELISVDYNNAELSEDVLHFAAYEVEPLIDLYQVMRLQIAPDFSQLLQEMQEHELLNPLKNKVGRKARLKGYDSNAVFIGGHKTVNKSHLLELLNGRSPKDAWMSTDTAVVLFHNRSEAVQGYEAIKRVMHCESVSLIVATTAVNITPKLPRPQAGPKSVLSDPSVIGQVVDIMTRVRCPIVVKIEDKLIDLYPGGEYPILTVAATEQTLSHLGRLFSDPSVPKVVETLEGTADVLATLSSTHGVRAKGMFDITNAYKVRDYLARGQSMTNAPGLNISEILTNMGMEGHSNVEQVMKSILSAYLYFQETLPAFALEYLQAKARLEADIAADYQTSQAFACLGNLRTLYEQSCVHVKPYKFIPDLHRRIQDEMKQIRTGNVWVYNNCAMIQLRDVATVSSCLDHMSSVDFQQTIPSRVKAVDTNFVPCKKTPKSVDQNKLQREGMTSHLENLESLGYGKIIACQTS